MTRPCKIGVQLPEVERFVPGRSTWTWRDWLRPRVRLGLGRRPPALRPARRQHPRPVRGVDDAGGRRRGHRAGGDRTAGGVDELPRAGHARQAGRDRRRDLAGPADRRARRRVEQAGVRRVRVRLRPSGQPVRRGAGDHRAAAARGPDDVPRRVLRRRRLRPRPAAGPRRRPADHAGLQQPADAEHRAARRGLLERLVEHLRQPGRAVRRGQGRGRRGDAGRPQRGGDRRRDGHP